ncbi:peptidoglycan binding domain-containing protein [Blautia stercoris]|uniref:L,D-transpeptidase family protein n=1 Tax=Blautia stercoris TaxID=871664 RepID=UPI00355C8942
MEETQGKKKHKVLKRVLIGLVILILLGLAAAYIAIGYYYQDKFYEGTIINGTDCSNQNVAYIKDIVKKEAEVYSLTIKERGDTQDMIDASDIQITYKDDNEIETIMKQQDAWKWIFRIGKDKNYTVSQENSYDETSLESYVNQMACMQDTNMTAPQDAYMKDNGSSYEIVPEVEGNTLDKTKTLETIKEAVDKREKEVSLEDAGCYVEPAVRQNDETLKKEVEQLNKMTSAQYVLDFGSGQETVDRNKLQSWLKEDEANHTYSFDETAVKQYVIDLSSKYNTEGKARSFVTSGGQTVNLTTGDYGYRLWQDKTTESLLTAMNSGESQTVEVTWLYKGQTHEGNEINGTYVEISISEQRMWFYKNGSLIVDTPVVTGNPNTGHATPAGGVWKLKDKKSPFTLTAYNPDGSQQYAEPVTYWMPFNGGVGIHDLTKRTAFGGDIYLTNGSHGCVNTPLDAVATIYNNIEINTPIVVY